MLECAVKLTASESGESLSRELRVISNVPKVRQPKPEWAEIRLGDPANQNNVLKLIEGLNLHTVA